VQPRVFADELGTLATPDDTLSLYPEDLGSHFLSEAVEQGDLSVRDTLEAQRALLEDAEISDGPVSASEVTLWTRILERASEDGALFEALQESAILDAPEPVGVANGRSSKLRR
jgi:hypothetical protein